MDFMSSPIVIAVAIVVVLVLVIALITSRIKVAGPNEAFIVTGGAGSKAVRNPETGQMSRDLSGQKVVMGGRVFVVPFVQSLHILDLSSRRIMVQIRAAVSGQGVKLNLDGVAIVKVGGNEDSIRAAAQRFLTQQDEVETFTQETLAGSLRSIVGSLSVEQIIRDRAAFAQRVADESEASLTGQGLVLDTFQIQDITDDGSYLSDLGRPEAARVGQTAAVAEAVARQSAEQARIAAEQEIAVSDRELALKVSEIKAETDDAQARAAASGPLAQADRDQSILAEQEKVAVRQAALKDRQLDTEVRKPADAERYRVEAEAEGSRNAEIKEADARRQAAIARAQADAETARLTGEGDKSRRTALAEAEAIEGARRGEAEKARRVAEAEAVRAEGEAEGAAILAKGQAEAEAMDKRAAAFAQYNDAAVLQMLVEVLPQVAEKVAAPMAGIDKLTVVSTDGAGAVPKQVTNNVVQTMELLKNTTGVDIQGLVTKYAGEHGRDSDSGSESSRTDAEPETTGRGAGVQRSGGQQGPGGQGSGGTVEGDVS